MNTPTVSPVYPSDLVLRALRVEPDGPCASSDAACLCCGKPIHVGDRYAPFSNKPSFMDDLSLAGRGSSVTCGACAALLTGPVMSKISKQVFTSDGKILPISTWDDCAAFLRNPPQPPFVAVYSTSSAFSAMHLAWRAPVTLSRDLIMVRIGARDVRIRRPLLLQAEQIARQIALKMGFEDGKAGGKTGPVLNPFIASSVTFDGFEFSHFRFGKGGMHFALAEDSLPQDLRFLRDLSLGELWGLIFLLNRP